MSLTNINGNDKVRQSVVSPIDKTTSNPVGTSPFGEVTSSPVASSPFIEVTSSDDDRFTPEKNYVGILGLTQCFQNTNVDEAKKERDFLPKTLTRELSMRKIDIKTAFSISPKPVFDKTSCSLYQQLVSTKANEMYTAAQASYESGLYKCITYLNKALFSQPNKVEYYILLGDSYLQLCDFKSAILNYKRVCILEPENDEYFSKLAFIYFLQGQCYSDEELFIDALECFSRASEMKPNKEEYHMKSIACLATLKRHKECLSSINKRLAMQSDKPDLLILRARLHLLFSNPTLSYFDIKEALALDPDNDNADSMQQSLVNNAEKSKDMALKLELDGKLKEALLKITSAIDINPDVTEYHIIRASMYRHNYEFNASVDDLLLAMNQCDQDTTHPMYIQAQQQLLLTFNDFAVHCFNKGFYEEAIILLEKAVKSEKNNKWLYINRGDCFFKLSHFHFALLDYQQADELSPNDDNVSLRLSVVYNEFALLDYKEHKYSSAEDYFSQAIDSNPTVPLYYLSRARSRYMQKHLEEAQVDIVSALHLDRNNNDIKSMFARLFSTKTINEVMESEFGLLVGEALQSVISDKTSDFNQFQKEKKVLPSIQAHSNIQTKLRECMHEKEFHFNIIKEKKKVKDTIDLAIQNRQNLTNSDSRINSKHTISSNSSKKTNWKSSSANDKKNKLNENNNKSLST